jgi:hypothetical protein
VCYSPFAARNRDIFLKKALAPLNGSDTQRRPFIRWTEADVLCAFGGYGQAKSDKTYGVSDLTVFNPEVFPKQDQPVGML